MTTAIDAAHRWRPLITWASDWDGVPARKNEGAVAYTLGKIMPCPDCGGLRYAGTGPHAPMWLDGRRVDCQGREVRP